MYVKSENKRTKIGTCYETIFERTERKKKNEEVTLSKKDENKKERVKEEDR